MTFLAVAAQFANRKGADDFGLPAVAAEDFASDLRLVHGLRHGEAAELVDQVEGRKTEGDEREHGAPKPFGEISRIEGEDGFLNFFFGGSHAEGVEIGGTPGKGEGSESGARTWERLSCVSH